MKGSGIIKTNFLKYELNISIIIELITVSCLFVISILEQKTIDLINVDNSLVVKYCIIITGIILLEYILELFKYYYDTYIFESESFLLKKQILSSFMKMPYSDKKDIKSGDFMTTMTQEVNKISKNEYSNKKKFIVTIFKFIGTFILISYYNIYVAIMSVIIIYSFTLINKSNYSKLSINLSEYYNIVALEQNNVLQAFASLKMIKQLKAIGVFLKEYDEIINKKEKKLNIVIKYYAYYAFVVSFLYVTYPIIILMICLYYVSNGAITLGVAILIYSNISSLSQPIRDLSDYLADRKIAKELVKKNEIYLKKYEIDDIKYDSEFNNLLFDSKGYSYDDKIILKDIKFKIEKGGIYTIVGKSGVGKSSIFNILSKFNDIKDVDVILDDEKLDNIPNKKLYSKILQAEQKPVIINGTLEENIVLGDTFSKEELEEIIDVCMLNNFVEKHGKDFIIDENISGGEKQRIGLARILIRKRKLNLLDEPTSALDAKTSENFVKNLNDYINKYNMTVLVITHRDDFKKLSKQEIVIT